MPAGFALPPSFCALHSAGRFDYWGAPYASLSDEQREELAKTRPHQVLWWKTIEWDAASSPEAVAAFSGDRQLRPDLIPFAGNGFGDQYCWYPRWQTGSETPVVFFVHDEHQSHLFARSFDECLVRCMLQHFAQWDEVNDGDESVMQSLWRGHLEILRPLLPQSLLGVLEGVSESLSASACETADDDLGRAIGKRSLVGAQQPTKYAEGHIKEKKTLLRLYDQSVAFYRELVDTENRPEFRSQLEETLANRVRVATTGKVPAKVKKAAKKAPAKEAPAKKAPAKKAPAKKTHAKKAPAKKTHAKKAAAKKLRRR